MVLRQMCKSKMKESITHKLLSTFITLKQEINNEVQNASNLNIFSFKNEKTIIEQEKSALIREKCHLGMRYILTPKIQTIIIHLPDVPSI